MSNHSREGFLKKIASKQRGSHPFSGEPIQLKTTMSQEESPREGLGTFTVSEIMQGMGSARSDAQVWDAFNQTMSGDLGHLIDTEGGVESILKGRAPLLAEDIASGKRTIGDGIFTATSGINAGVGQLISGADTVGVEGGDSIGISTESGQPGDSNYEYAGQGSAAMGPGNKIYHPPAGKSWKKGKQTYEQVADLALSIGLNVDMAILFTAIAYRESRHNSQAHNPNASTGDNSWGLWQINTIDGAMLQSNLDHWRQFDLTDPWTNAKGMKFLLDSGGSPEQNWYTNRDGTGARAGYSVTEYMPKARAAVQAVLSRGR